MTTALIIISSIAALLSDFYIWRRGNRRHSFGPLWKYGYLIYALIIDTAVVTALLMYRGAVDNPDGVLLRAVMLVIALFFLHAVPKVIYALVSLGDYVVQHFRRGRDSHWFGMAGIFLGLASFVMLLHGMTVGRSRIEVKTVELTFDNLPRSFDGLRVVQFSDLHLGSLVNRDKFLANMVEIINDLHPDIVLNTGDIVNTHARELDYTAMSLLSGIESRYGVYGVPGNHDKGVYIHNKELYAPEKSILELTERIQMMGWHELSDASAFVTNGADMITISGFDYPEGIKESNHSRKIKGAKVDKGYAAIPDSLFNITMIHAPQMWNEVRPTGYADLTLAGHVHAFQLKFSAGSRTWSPAAILYDRWSGLYEEEGKYLYINDGLGYVMFPMRVGVKPEITLFILRSSKND